MKTGGRSSIGWVVFLAVAMALMAGCSDDSDDGAPAPAGDVAAPVEQDEDHPVHPMFPSARGSRLSADGVQYLVAKHVATAGRACPSLTRKRVTPHVLRHTTAMELLQAGVDRSVIAMWLGHESLETTQIYLDADLTLKERVLDKIAPPSVQARRYRPEDKLMAFLSAL